MPFGSKVSEKRENGWTEQNGQRKGFPPIFLLNIHEREIASRESKHENANPLMTPNLIGANGESKECVCEVVS